MRSRRRSTSQTTSRCCSTCITSRPSSSRFARRRTARRRAEYPTRKDRGLRYLLRRVGFFLLTLWAALTLNFFLPHFMPGSPINSLRAATRGRVPDAQLERILASYGFKPNANIFSQYLDYLGKMLTGNFGVSTGGSSLGQPVSKM